MHYLKSYKKVKTKGVFTSIKYNYKLMFEYKNGHFSLYNA